MKKIVIAADSFKGSISSRRFADVCCEAIHAVLPDCDVTGIPLGDGGEGTVEALTDALGGTIVTAKVCDPLMRPVVASYGISGDGCTAVIEMAQASGLPLLAEDERDPLRTTTYGTGELIADAVSRGCTDILIGIGGSATNDGGMGMLTALGAVFYDKDGRKVESPGCGADLVKIASVDLSKLYQQMSGVKVRVACDVDNPLCGPRGATRVFGRQKGATDAMIEELEIGMSNYALVITEATGVSVVDMPGAGAAGGVGGALAAVLNAHLMPGIRMVLDAVRFDERIKGADLIITGEGRIDSQTLMGKTPFGVLTAARRQNIPVVALGGSVVHSGALDHAGFATILSIQPGPMSLADALNPDTACRNLRYTVLQLMSLIRAVGK